MAAFNRIYSPRQDRRFMAEVQDEVDEIMSERVNFTLKYGAAAAPTHGSVPVPNRVAMRSKGEQTANSLPRKRTQR